MAIDISSIATGVCLKPPKVVLYGTGGIGKTTWASNAPNPIFILTEAGQGILDIARFPFCNDWVSIIECCRVLHEQKHDYGPRQ